MQNIQILTYFYSQADGSIGMLSFVDGIELEKKGTKKFDIRATPEQVPPNFFSNNISHISAIVGRNSLGKSTVLRDICRILGGAEPVARAYTLVVSDAQGLAYQLSDNKLQVTFNGEPLDHGDTGRNDDSNLKVLYYSSGYDPYGSKASLFRSDAGQMFCDISDQFVYTQKDGSDFTDKIVYLQALARAELLIFEPHKKIKREIRFYAEPDFDVDLAARYMVELALKYDRTGLHRQALISLLADIGAAEHQAIYDALQLSDIDGSYDPDHHFLNDEVKGYFELLRGYVLTHSNSALAKHSLAFALAISKVIDIVNFTDETDDLEPIRPLLEMLLNDFDVTLGHLFEEPLLPLLWQLPSSEDDKAIATIHLTGKYDADTHAAAATLLRLHQLAFRLTFRFSGISEGQRTLLTLYSRLYAEAVRSKHDGPTLLVIDEHDHGLHPEWQRRYLRELIKLLGGKKFNTSRFQIIMATHSPFLVADLPRAYVNIVNDARSDHTPTLAANLLDLLLSPLFLESTTGAFAAEKIADFLKQVKAAKTIEEVRAARFLLPLLGDDLIRNYCTIRADEKEWELAKK